ncbi:glycoside hydrolase family 10 protein [Membranihabitans maritimus]|uniref:glycoside hydrolase family 10 protein n=1 Tax=Membranihabitans maritimus TaxID=2904244 RepID=UPI001F18DE5D|nr:family 10 glycosylhydrolase [Membranihabitans maritimus]
MFKFLSCESILILIAALFVQTGATSQVINPKRELRGVWIATVANIDWPSSPGLTVERQKKELLKILDHHEDLGINALFFQIRPTTDAFYAKGEELWSYYLSGKQGKAPDPFYDPLQFLIDEAHYRGMELHAWFNPYRAANDNDPNKVSEDHISKLMPEWFFEYEGKTYFDPGIPAVREYIESVVLNVVENYDIDGIHFDDYFYPYPGKEMLPDSISFLKYGEANFDRIEDWRRNNVDLLVESLTKVIHDAKPYVKFGISPFAIWRNEKEDPRGSESNGFTNYDGLYADVYNWMENQWLDYVMPQIYFPFHYTPAPFEKLLKWWGDNRFGRHVYVGQGVYRAEQNKNGWEDRSQLPRQVKSIRQDANAQGSVYFSSKSLSNNLGGFRDSLRHRYYRFPALLPPMPWLDNAAPASPVNLRHTQIDRFVRLRWDDPESRDTPYGYIVYRFGENENINFERPDNIIHISFDSDKTFFFDTNVRKGKSYRYYVSSLDRLKNEGHAIGIQVQVHE